MGAYPYSEDWKSAVDKTSDEWRGYCEALALLKRYLLLEKNGRSVAVRDYKETIGRMMSDSRSVTRVARLDADFKLVGRYEADALRTLL